MVEHPQLRQEQLEIATLGACQYKSPLVRSLRTGEGVGTYVPDDMRVLYEPCLLFGEQVNPLSFERAGAREHLFFDPTKTKAAIVSCGGLCPGINNVIRGLVLELTFTSYALIPPMLPMFPEIVLRCTSTRPKAATPPTPVASRATPPMLFEMRL